MRDISKGTHGFRKRISGRAIALNRGGLLRHQQLTGLSFFHSDKKCLVLYHAWGASFVG